MLQRLDHQWYGNVYEVTAWVVPPEAVYRIIIRDQQTGSVIAYRDAECANPGYAQFADIYDELRGRRVIDIDVEICVNDERVGRFERRTVLTPFQGPDLPLDCSGVVQDLGPTLVCGEILRDARAILALAQNACARQADECDDDLIEDLERQAAAFVAMAILLSVAAIILSYVPFAQSGVAPLLAAAIGCLMLAGALQIAAAAQRASCRDASGDVREQNRRLSEALRNLNSGMACCPSWIPIELRNLTMRPCEPRSF